MYFNKGVLVVLGLLLSTVSATATGNMFCLSDKMMRKTIARDKLQIINMGVGHSQKTTYAIATNLDGEFVLIRRHTNGLNCLVGAGTDWTSIKRKEEETF